MSEMGMWMCVCMNECVEDTNCLCVHVGVCVCVTHCLARSGVEYTGARKAEDIVSEMRMESGSACKLITTIFDMEKLTEGSDVRKPMC